MNKEGSGLERELYEPIMQYLKAAWFKDTEGNILAVTNM